jgi:hypothetical protein
MYPQYSNNMIILKKKKSERVHLNNVPETSKKCKSQKYIKLVTSIKSNSDTLSSTQKHYSG